MKITFRQIDAFRTVVSTGTVTESAQILGISQPAVSRLISDLEAEVGFKLFTRVGRNLKPSLEARLLVDEVRTALSGLERIKQAADSIRKFKHARLRLVTTPAFSTLLTPRLIKAFAARRPEAMVSLEIQPNDDTVEWMISQNHDFGVAPPTGKNTSMENLDLINSDAVCIFPEGHRLASLSKVTPQDLASESFISYQPDAQFRFEVDDVFRKAGVERGMQFEARTTDAICCLVEAGLGVSIVGSAEGARGTRSGCQALPFEPMIPFRAALTWSTQKTLSAVAEDFLAMIREEFSPG